VRNTEGATVSTTESARGGWVAESETRGNYARSRQEHKNCERCRQQIRDSATVCKFVCVHACVCVYVHVCTFARVRVRVRVRVRERVRLRETLLPQPSRNWEGSMACTTLCLSQASCVDRVDK